MEKSESSVLHGGAAAGADSAAGTTTPEPRPVWRPQFNSQVDLYAFLAAFGVLSHVYRGRYSTPFDNVGVVVIVVAAAAVMLRPSSRAWLAVLSVGILIDVGFEAPFIVNHWIVVGVLAIFTLVCLAIARTGSHDGVEDPLQPLLLPLVGVGLMATFLWAAIHKLNTGFYDTAISCAVEHQRSVLELFRLPAAGGGVPSGGVIGTAFLLEFGIPLALATRRWRWLAVAAGFLFHYFNAVNGHFAFSALALSFYVPFLPADTWRAFNGTGIGTVTRRWGPRVTAALLAMGAVWVIGGPLLAAVGISASHWRAGALPYLFLGAMVAALVAAHWSETRSLTVKRENDAFHFGGRVAVAVCAAAVLLLSANAMTQYTGIKTENALSMFSNVRTEPGVWNHSIFPESLSFVDRYSTYVEVTEWGPTGSVADVVDDGTLINEFELRRAIGDACDGGPVAVSFRFDGSDQLIKHSNACDEPIGEALPVLERKFLRFRPIADPNVCQH